MNDTFTQLEFALANIEINIKEKLTAESLARAVFVSSPHLQRLFRLAFERPLMSYVRSRKLAASLEMLLQGEERITDIAQEYGFEYERSYIRAFKREFGLTPTEIRAKGLITTVSPPLQLTRANKKGEGLFFGPEFVMIPAMHLIGRLHKVPFALSSEMAPRVARDFWINDKEKIGCQRDDIWVGLTRIPPLLTDFTYYMPSVSVEKGTQAPEGLHTDSIPATLCAKFHYIGAHHPFELDDKVMQAMYDEIEKFRGGLRHESPDDWYFERIVESDIGDDYCKLEWFMPMPTLDATGLDLPPRDPFVHNGLF